MLDDVAEELAALAVDLDIEKRISREGQMGEGEGSDDENENNSLDGWADARKELSDEEREALHTSPQPVRETSTSYKCSKWMEPA